jgi:hypothetical protein
MGDERRSTGTGGRGLTAFRIAVLLGFIALAVVGCVFIESILDGPTMPTPSEPAATGSHPAPATSASPPPTPASSAPPTARPPTVPGAVGDYRCLTLKAATAAIERDGYVIGTVSYSIEGGAVDATWLVDTQDPPPGVAAAPGTKVSLLLANPFNVCRATSAAG